MHAEFQLKISDLLAEFCERISAPEEGLYTNVTLVCRVTGAVVCCMQGHQEDEGPQGVLP